MEIRVRGDRVEITGYVNAVERNSKPLNSRMGRFIERICKGAFKRAIDRNDDIKCKLNHDRVLGGIREGNLELMEDSIGLRARFETDDAEVIDDAKNGRLVGWSFGFNDINGGVEERSEDGMPLRVVHDLDLNEVSILNNKKTPAYDGTLIMARDDDAVEFYGEVMEADVKMKEDEIEETPEERAEPETEIIIDYSKYESMIAEMKGEKE